MYKKIQTESNKKSKKMVEQTFQRELDYIKHEDIRNFAIEMLRLAPGYFYSIPSSSSGKYHPAYENSKGGLILHVKTVVFYMISLFNLEMYNIFTDREKDLLIVSALLHDFKKNGEKAHSEYTSFEHPRIAANYILKFKDCEIIPEKEIEYIADAVKAHMGQWNTNGKNSKFAPLDKPQTAAQKFLHMCDYLSSREEIDLSKYLFAESEILTTEAVKETKITFGKYKGRTYGEIFEEDVEYLDWCYVKNMQNIENKEKTFIPTTILEGLKRILYVENV